MATLDQHKQIISKLNSKVNKVPSFEQLQVYFSEATYILEDCPQENKYPYEVSGYAKAWCEKLYMNTKDKRFWDMYWDIMKWEAPNRLDSYCIYVERNRPAKERFYLPRRKTLIKVVNMYQQMEDDDIDECFIHQAPRTGKSQAATMAMAWHASRNPESNNLYCTYKESLGGSFVDGVIEIMTDPTYLHKEVFPNVKIKATDAKAHKLWLNRKRKYATLSGKGLESGLNGEYDANGWLLIDDILEGIQDVLSPDVLKRKQIIFDNNLMSRKKEKCKVVYNGTIWSLHDIFSDRLDFIKNSPTMKDLRYDVLKIPALDPVTDESNFNYDYGVGFSTDYFRQQRAKFESNDDMASWFAQYQQEPIERDGAVFNPEHMNFYNGVLPDEEPIRICAALDVALGGLDYLSMPIAYIYEDGSVYIHDVVFSNEEKDKTQPEIVRAVINNNIGSIQIENNNAGSLYKDELDKLLRENGERINLVGKWSTGRGRGKGEKAKEQRIWDKAPEIREFYFLDEGYRSPMYSKFMTNLYTFTVTGKAKHDDAADSLAMLADFIKNTGVRTARIMKSPI
ncbi:MAG: hypothetical protein LUI12_01900 [Clostridiales bacterium]|nr:hypothetical protein [Clostridiales bacterium]